jgi:hypothetical protein
MAFNPHNRASSFQIARRRRRGRFSGRSNSFFSVPFARDPVAITSDAEVPSMPLGKSAKIDEIPGDYR